MAEWEVINLGDDLAVDVLQPPKGHSQAQDKGKRVSHEGSSRSRGSKHKDIEEKMMWDAMNAKKQSKKAGAIPAVEDGSGLARPSAEHDRADPDKTALPSAKQEGPEEAMFISMVGGGAGLALPSAGAEGTGAGAGDFRAAAETGASSEDGGTPGGDVRANPIEAGGSQGEAT